MGKMKKEAGKVIFPKNSRWVGAEWCFSIGKTVIIQRDNKFLHAEIVEFMPHFRFRVKDKDNNVFDVDLESISHINMS